MAGWVESRFRDWMKSVERRLSTMETQQRLFNASVKGGAITAYDDTLTQVVRLGVGAYSSNSGSITSPLFAVSDDTGSFHVLIDTKRGWVYPNWAINFDLETNFTNNNTGGASLSAWKTTLAVVSRVLIVTVVVFPTGGANGELWLDLDAATHTTNHAVINNPAGQTVTFRWDVSSLGYFFGQNMTLRIYCKITNGTGQLLIPTPDNCFFSILENYPTADANGDV